MLVDEDGIHDVASAFLIKESSKMIRQVPHGKESRSRRHSTIRWLE